MYSERIHGMRLKYSIIDDVDAPPHAVQSCRDCTEPGGKGLGCLLKSLLRGVAYLREVLKKAANSEQFKTALANLGQEPAYMDQPEFAAFWEADTKRIEAAIRSIGKVEG